MNKITKEDVTNMIQFAALIHQVRGASEPDALRPGHDILQGLLYEAAYAVKLVKYGKGPIAEAFDRAKVDISAERPPRRPWQPPHNASACKL